jgi:cytochrome c biogenesis protein ResB
VLFADFRGNFSIGKEKLNEDTSSYPNPAAILQVTPPDGTPLTAYAFDSKMSNIPVAEKPVAGYTFQMVEFEKVADQHILSVQRDPGANVVYIGFTLLFMTLVAVFFFSFKQVWTVVEQTSENEFALTVAGKTNRNKTGLEEKLNLLVGNLKTKPKEKI